MTTTTISTSTNSRVTLTSTGTLIVTSSGAISLTNGNSVVFAPNGFGAITNSGLIANPSGNNDLGGIASYGSAGTITNSGSIIVADRVIYISGNLDELYNSGIITSQAGELVDIEGNATVDNAAGGTISTPADSYALAVGGTADINNQGLISGSATYTGAVKVEGANSVITNSGTIQNMSGPAILFASAGGTLIVDPGSTIIGSVLDQASDGTLELGGTTANIVTYSAAQYEGFPTISFDNPDATLVGSATDLAGETLTNWNGGDTLQITGVSASSAGYNNGQLVLSNSGGVVETLNLGGDNGDSLYTTGFSVSSTNDTTTVSGTITVNAASNNIHINDGDSINITADTTVTGSYMPDENGAIFDPGTIENLSNAGTLLEATGPYVIYAGGNIEALDNTGTISGEGSGIFVVGTATNITNSGTIAVPDDAITVYGQADIINSGLLSSVYVTDIYIGGQQSVVTNSGTLLGSGAIDFDSNGDTLILEQGSVIAGEVVDYGGSTYTGDGTLILGGTGSDTQTFSSAQYDGFPTIEFDSASATLVGSAEDLASANETITGVAAGDRIELNDFAATSSSFSGTLLTLTNGSATATLSITSADAFSRFDIASENGTTSILDAACYVRGTRIRTAQGEVAIEDLREGDRVVTAAGAMRPVRWIGYRTVQCDKHPAPETVWPVCVSADAFGPGLPRRDLWLSPAHAIAVEDGLIAVILLVNGVTIRQHRRAVVTYYHVELDSHDIILAENLPAESYLDTGNRAAFENAGGDVQLHPDFRPRATHDFCRPLYGEGPEVTRARRGLMRRAGEMGYAQSDSPDLHVVADGARIEPINLPENMVAFCLPEGARAISLNSRSFMPAADGANADRRLLGVCLKDVQIDGSLVPLDDARVFQRGWHAHERNGDGGWRWSDGEAFIPAGTRLVVMRINAVGRYWVEVGGRGKEAVLF
jgi:hypothetical protein